MEQKAFCLFALLFGVGLGIQYERLVGDRPAALLAHPPACVRAARLRPRPPAARLERRHPHRVRARRIPSCCRSLRLPQQGAALRSRSASSPSSWLARGCTRFPGLTPRGCEAHVAAANQAYATGSLARDMAVQLARAAALLHAARLGLSAHASALPPRRFPVAKRRPAAPGRASATSSSSSRSSPSSPAPRSRSANAGLAPVFLALAYGGRCCSSPQWRPARSPSRGSPRSGAWRSRTTCRSRSSSASSSSASASASSVAGARQPRWLGVAVVRCADHPEQMVATPISLRADRVARGGR